MKNLHLFFLLSFGCALQGMNNELAPVQNLFYHAYLSSEFLKNKLIHYSDLRIEEITPETHPALCQRMLLHDPVAQKMLSYDSKTHAIYVARSSNLKGVKATKIILQAVSEYRKNKKLGGATSLTSLLCNKIDTMEL